MEKITPETWGLGQVCPLLFADIDTEHLKMTDTDIYKTEALLTDMMNLENALRYERMRKNLKWIITVLNLRNVRFDNQSPAGRELRLCDTCSWKGQFEKTRSWNVLSRRVRYEIGKKEVGKFSLKLESPGQSWKVLIWLGKNQWNWKERSWKVQSEVGKFWFDLERINEIEKLSLKLVRSIVVVKIKTVFKRPASLKILGVL